MRAAFRQPGFRLLYGGLLASMVGDSLMLIVLAIWVKDLTGSNGAAGLTFFFLAAPALVAPLIGMVVDRFTRRSVLFWGNLASALAVVPLLLVRDQDDVWIVYAVTVLYGISFIALPAGLNGLLKEMLPDALLVDANASLSTSKESLRLVGPLLGAGLFTLVGGGAVAVIDASTFVIAAVAIRALRVQEDRPLRDATHFRDEVLAGVRHIRRDRVLLHTMISLGVALLVIGFMEAAVFAMVDAFGKPASWVGVIVSVQGVGAVAGGFSSSQIIKRIGEVGAISVSLAGFALGLALCAATPMLSLVFLGVVVLGFTLPVFIVAFTTLLQRRTPHHLMGRVSAAADVIIGTPQAISIALGALLVSLVSYRTIYWISAVVLIASAGYLVLALGRRPTTAPDLIRGGVEAAPTRPGPVGLPDTLAAAAVGGLDVSSAGDGPPGQVSEDPSEVQSRGLHRQRDE